MSRARAVLHLAALVVPFAVAAVWSVIANRADTGFDLEQTVIFGGLGALSAQVAAALRWRALDRRARAGEGAWKAGIGMAAITHALFGVLFAAAVNASVLWLQPEGASGATDVMLQVVFFVAVSMLVVGLATFPLTAALAQGVAALRRKELADGAR